MEYEVVEGLGVGLFVGGVFVVIVVDFFGS